MKDVVDDVRRLTQAGVRALEKDLDRRIVDKRHEVRRLRHVATSLSTLVQQGDDAFPVDIEYQYSHPDSTCGFVTKTETLVVADASEAEDQAARITRRLDRWSELRDRMVEELERKRTAVRAAKSEIQGFLRFSRSLLGDVLVSLR